MALNRNLEKTIAGQVIIWDTRLNDGLSLGALCFRVCPSSLEGRWKFRELCEISATVARGDWWVILTCLGPCEFPKHIYKRIEVQGISTLTIMCTTLNVKLFFFFHFSRAILTFSILSTWWDSCVDFCVYVIKRLSDANQSHSPNQTVVNEVLSINWTLYDT